jgi:ATP-dependent Lon protease
MDDKNITLEIKKLEEKLAVAKLPEDLKEKCSLMVNRLNITIKGGSYSLDYESVARYLEWVASLPWYSRTKDILDLTFTKDTLDKSHYGINDVKDIILEYLGVMVMKQQRRNEELSVSRAPILCLVGLPGTGKTTIAYSIANALGRRMERIPFGGMGGAALLRGQSRVFPDAEPGAVIKSLRRCRTSNPVILLDEIDRVSQSALADIMGVLIELLDPEQNNRFIDHFIDYPVNLSNVLFIATANNTGHISNAVMDRLEIIQMPSYTDDEKRTIGKQYMFPKIIRESGLSEDDIIIDESVWDEIVRPLGYDPGIRTLQRTIQGMVRKIIRYMLEGKIRQHEGFVVSSQNVKQFMPSL